MRSKKKLIYKLHENMQQNPFKPIQEISFRNTGVRVYDFNKIKSIRAMSLNGLNTAPTQEIKKQNNIAKVRKTGESYFITQNNQQNSPLSQKKENIHRDFIDLESKKLQVRKPTKNYKQLVKCKSPQTLNRQISNCPRYQQIDCKKYYWRQDQNDDQIIDCVTQKVVQLYVPGIQTRHEQYLSFPLLNQNKQDKQLPTLNSVNLKQRFYSSVNQQKAKKLLLRQLKITSQQKTNKQILMSIKPQSISNLQRNGRSRSQFIQIDKWKEKYAKKKQNNQGQYSERIKKVFASTKVLLPKFNKIILEKYVAVDKMQQTDKQGQHVVETNEIIQSQQNSIRNSKNQKLKYFTSQSDCESLSPQKNISPEKQYSNAQTAHFINPCQQSSLVQFNCDRQNLSQERQLKNSNYRQPFSITKMKKHERKNRQNLNLENKMNKHIKNYESPQKRKRKFSNQQKSNQTNDQLTNQKNQKCQLFWTERGVKSNCLQQDDSPNKQIIMKCEISPSLAKSEKQNRKLDDQASVRQDKQRQHKPSQQDNILNKIVQHSAPKQWQHQIAGDYQEIQFGNFVTCQRKQIFESKVLI